MSTDGCARSASARVKFEHSYSSRSSFDPHFRTESTAESVENGKRLNCRIVLTTFTVALCMDEKVKRSPKLITVSERNLQSAAIRLLPKHNKLVTPEVDYLRRVLGDKATQVEIDEKVMAVRSLPWNQIVAE